MDTFEIQSLTFCYPQQTANAIDKLCLTVRQGEFLVLCGQSGGGKTTLLKNLKPALTPHGRREGSILFEGLPLESLDFRAQSAQIGFVMQDPDNQIITDKVWHELAFGLESLGYDTPVIRRRVAEMASFFGIEDWFYREVATLSGGQKQLLNLASVMAMQPRVLILDEPTAQLDPIAAADFLAVVAKINRELGVTVMLTEHRLEEALPIATRAVVLERGKIVADGTPSEVGSQLLAQKNGMFSAMPTSMRIWAAVPNTLPCPVTVREGRQWLEAHLKAHTPPQPAIVPAADFSSAKPVITADNVWFRYEQEEPDILKGLTLTLHQGELFALLGVNGAGKSTCLRLLAGLNKPQRGEIHLDGAAALLPQNPKAMFLKKTVREDLLDTVRDFSDDAASKNAKLTDLMRLCLLDELLDRHPYDLSGGELQRAALCKVLLRDPDILLLDEPTKGLDAQFKGTLAEILVSLRRRGKAILLVSHDIEFCAACADTCGLLFDGNVVTSGPPLYFFSGNSFYTTAANRISRGLLDGCVTAEAVIIACGGTPEPSYKALREPTPPPPPAAAKIPADPVKLPKWRKAVAFAAAFVALTQFILATKAVDFSVLSDLAGASSAAVFGALQGTLVFTFALIVFATAVGRRAPLPVAAAPIPSERRKVSRRTGAAAGVALALIPLTLYAGATLFAGKKYYFIALLVLLECMLPFFMIFEGRKPQAKELVVIAVLCAIGVAGRAAFFMLPQFKPVMALAIVAGIAFGGETGFLTGAMTMLASNVMFSQGPWTPWQMFAMGLTGFFAGGLFRAGLLRRTRVSICAYGGLAAIILYGGIMNFASALLWQGSVNFNIFLAYCATGFPMDLIHAAGTMVFLWFAAIPMLEKLDRIKMKYGILS